MAKLYFARSLSLFLMCALAPAVVNADRFQARFELVNSIGLSLQQVTPSTNSSQCSQDFDSGNVQKSSCPAFSVVVRDLLQYEATLLVDGVAQQNWQAQMVGEDVLRDDLADEIALVLQ
jgi:hypothetical protein